MTASAPNAADLPQSSLYVGDLHPKVTDAMLYQKFLDNGPIMSVRVCVDVATRDSLGYGYVNFQDPKDAERALDNMNYDVLEGRPIRIMWSHRDPSLRKSGKGNVFIKNLHKSIEQKELYDTFRYFGKILSCKIASDEAGNSKAYGFVHFASEESANSAIKKLNSMVIRERVVYVGKFIPSSERKSNGGKAKFNNCYIKNFKLDYDDEWLRNLFSEFGEIKSAVVAKDENGRSKGFGFVCFHDPDNAEKAVLALNSKKLDDLNLYVTKALRKDERQEELRQRAEKQRQERQSKYDTSVNLYVKNLDENVTDEQLRDVFSKYGIITSAKVMTDDKGSRLFGFVCFQNPEEAARAVSDMNGALVGSKPLYVAIAQRKEDRRAHLVAEHQKRINNPRPALPPLASALNPGYYSPFHQQRMFSQLINQPRWSRTNLPIALSNPNALNQSAGVPTANARGMATSPYAMAATGATQLQTGQALGTTISPLMFRTQQVQQQGQVHQQQQVQPGTVVAGRQGMIQAAGGPGAPTLIQTAYPQMNQMVQHQNSVVQRNQIQAAQQQRNAVNMHVANVSMTPQQAAAHQQQAQVAQNQAAAAAAAQQQQATHQVQQQHMMNPAGMVTAPPRMTMADVVASNVGATRQQMPAGHTRMMSNQQAGVRFITSARNVAPNTVNQAQQAAAQQQSQNQQGVLAPMAGESGSLTMFKLAQMPDKQQKELLGNKLFPLVKKRYDDLAGKLTGMLLEMESSDIIHMLESADALQSKLDEAIAVINAHKSDAANASSGDTANATTNASSSGSGGNAAGAGGHGGSSGKGKHGKHHNNAAAAAVANADK